MNSSEKTRLDARESVWRSGSSALTFDGIHTLPGLLLLAALVASCPVPVLAQSIDLCMESDPGDTVEICQSILDSGSRNADVYWTLVSALFQRGDTVSANEVLDKARSLYPGNRKLQRLDVLINSNLDENQLLEKAARKNTDSVTLGTLKIACRTKDSLEALEACRRYLELSDDDGDQISSRLAWLEGRHGDVVANTAITDAAVPAIVGDGGDAEVAVVAPTTDTPDRIAFRHRVAEVQTGLNALGFDAGSVDGVPGALTRRALARFYASTRRLPREDFNEQTLNDVLIERRLRATAARQRDQPDTSTPTRESTREPAQNSDTDSKLAQTHAQEQKEQDSRLVMLESSARGSSGRAEAGELQRKKTARQLAQVMAKLDNLEVELAFELRQFDDHMSELREATDRAVRLAGTTVLSP